MKKQSWIKKWAAVMTVLAMILSLIPAGVI